MPALALPASSGRATWADVSGLPEGTRVEILDGEIVFAPAPLPRHQWSQGALVYRVGGPFGMDGAPGGWWILAGPDVQLDPHLVVEPDVAGWRREHVAAFPEERPIRDVPAWVCEILSPSTRRHDFLRKANAYLRVGVEHYWLVDPEARTLEARERLVDAAGHASWRIAGVWGEGDAAGIAPFEGVTLEVATLFPPRPNAER